MNKAQLELRSRKLEKIRSELKRVPPRTLTPAGEGEKETIWEDEFWKLWPLERILSEGKQHGFIIYGFTPGEGWKEVIKFPFAVLNGIYIDRLTYETWGFYDSMTSEDFILAQAHKELKELGDRDLLPKLCSEAFGERFPEWCSSLLEFFKDERYLNALTSVVRGKYELSTLSGKLKFQRDLEDINYHELNGLLSKLWETQF